MNEDKRPYAERIRQERIRLDLPQSILSSAAGISKATQVAYEADLHVPSLEYLNAIGSLGVDTIFVLTGIHKIQFVESEYNWELMMDILNAIFKYSKEKNLQIPSNKRGIMIRMFYKKFSLTGLIDHDYMESVFQLIN